MLKDIHSAKNLAWQHYRQEGCFRNPFAKGSDQAKAYEQERRYIYQMENLSSARSH